MQYHSSRIVQKIDREIEKILHKLDSHSKRLTRPETGRYRSQMEYNKQPDINGESLFCNGWVSGTSVGREIKLYVHILQATERKYTAHWADNLGQKLNLRQVRNEGILGEHYKPSLVQNLVPTFCPQDLLQTNGLAGRRRTGVGGLGQLHRRTVRLQREVDVGTVLRWRCGCSGCRGYARRRRVSVFREFGKHVCRREDSRASATKGGGIEGGMKEIRAGRQHRRLTTIRTTRVHAIAFSQAANARQSTERSLCVSFVRYRKSARSAASRAVDDRG